MARTARRVRLLVLGLGAAILAFGALAAQVRYVVPAGAGAQTGTSWDDAFSHPQLAVDDSVSGDEVWVAAGIYTDSDADDIVLDMKADVSVYGGFSGGESSRDQRNWESNVATLDGEDLRLVVEGASNIALDGFTITRGFLPTTYGAGMRNIACSAVTVANCTFSSSRAYKGAGLYLNGSDATITGCSFLDNIAEYPFDGRGAGMYVFDPSGPVMVADCLFSGNIAMDGPGGGIFVKWASEPVSVVDCVFSGNISLGSWHPDIMKDQGGDGGGGMASLRSDISVLGCTFSANEAECVGGGMYSHDDVLTIEDTLFDGNLCQPTPLNSYGGGFYAYSYSRIDASVDINATAFRANRAQRGGGLYLYFAPALLTNCTITGNSAVRGGGLQRFGYDAAAFANCVFAGNAARDAGGAGAIGGDDASFTNCIFWNNTAPESPLFDYDGAPVVQWAPFTISSSCIEGGWPGPGNTDLNPLFVDPGYRDDNGTPDSPMDDSWTDGDYRPRAGSPCIDAADGDAAPATDFDGAARHDDPGMTNVGSGAVSYADMGAYEFQGTTPNFRLSLNPSSALEGAGLLAAVGRVSVVSPLASALTITLTSSDATKVAVPPVVVIPAGQSSATFDVTLLDNEEGDGPQLIRIDAYADGYARESAVLDVYDDEFLPFGGGCSPGSGGPAPVRLFLGALLASVVLRRLFSRGPAGSGRSRS